MRVLFPMSPGSSGRHPLLEALPPLSATVRLLLVAGVVGVISLVTDAPEFIQRETLHLFDPGHGARQRFVEWHKATAPCWSGCVPELDDALTPGPLDEMAHP